MLSPATSLAHHHEQVTVAFADIKVGEGSGSVPCMGGSWDACDEHQVWTWSQALSLAGRGR